MIISTKHKFVFLSNRKCASSSLVHVLEPFAALSAKVDHRLRHTNYRQYKKYVEPYLEFMTKEDLSDYKIFCLFREPTDWLFSWYRFRQRHAISPEVQPGHWEYTGHITWHEFLDAYFSDDRPPFARVGNQCNFVTDAKGRLGDMSIFKYEEIEKCVSAISERVGEQLEMVNYNTSPKIDDAISAADQVLCRSMLKREYEIYDAL